ncbi:MAG: hypothetical protein Q9219_001746 [cf. Caloplaca sp. 3 TL-2023]
MEGDGQQRRQHERQQFPRDFGPGYRPNMPEVEATARLGHSQMLMRRSPASVSASSATGAHPQELGGFGYSHGAQYPPAPIQSSSLQFPTDYGPDQQRSQHFPQYTSAMVYNVPQQSHTRSPYDALPQYQPRQSASLEVMSNQLGVSSYYPSGEPSASSGQTSPDQQYAPSQFHQSVPYQTPGHSRQAIHPAYATGMTEYSQSAVQGIGEQPEPEDTTHQEEYDRYEEALRQVFEDTSKGRVIEAAQLLLEISEWLLSHVKELGLVSDNESLREERLILWSRFNTCWLAVLQRQKDNVQQMLETGQPPVPPQNILQEAFLEQMAEALLHLCDGMEKYGLVDYQMGVWEEEIMSILTQCLDLLEGDDIQASEGGGPMVQEG